MRQDEREAGFSEYVVAQQPRMLRTARLLAAGDDHLAEDLVQATLTRLYVHWPRVARAEDPVAYGFRALVNGFLDTRRRGPGRFERSSPDPVPPASTSMPSGDPETRALVLDALRSLPARQRAVVVLRHWLDLDVRSTAEALGCSEGTVKSQNSKALEHLRTALSVHVREGNI